MIPLRDNIPSRRVPFINYLLIAANTVVFLYELSIPEKGIEDFFGTYGAVPAGILSQTSSAWTLFTSMFLHGGWMHFLGNMLYLYIFGDNVEDHFGKIRYLLFYILSGITAGVCQIALSPKSALPLVGASGAIAGVLGAYFLLYPRAKVLTLVPLGFFTRLVQIPAFFFLGFWFLMQAFTGTTHALTEAAYQQAGGVAWWAHAGGFLAGIGLLLTLGPSRHRR